jgi:hypothetical protein
MPISCSAYVLADPMMNRNASYVALIRHRQGVEVYTDRATFATREHLDSALSRAPGTDLARDYAVAALGRNAARIVPLQKRQADLHEALRQLGGARQILETSADEERRLARPRGGGMAGELAPLGGRDDRAHPADALGLQGTPRRAEAAESERLAVEVARRGNSRLCTAHRPMRARRPLACRRSE